MMLIAQSKQLILPILTCISFVVVICCFILHLKNHFGLKYSICSNFDAYESPQSSNTYKHKHKHKRHNQNTLCCCHSSTGRIQFYPVSTLLYFTFLLGSIVFISIFYFDYYLHSPQIAYCPIKYNILLFINNPFPFESLPIFIEFNTNISLYDIITLYICLILVLWETLFNWYRFYDSTYLSKYLRNASKTRIFSLFSIYMFLFIALYSIQIHFYYGIFPLIILIHFIFNTYCAVGFISILKHQHVHLWEGESAQIKKNRRIKELSDIIRGVQRCSIITTFTSSLILFLINGCYTNYTIILLPILWMISSIVWVLNFAKNKSWINKKYQLIKRRISISKNNTNTNTNINTSLQIHKSTLKLKSETNTSLQKEMTNINDTNTELKAQDKLTNNKNNNNTSEVSVPVPMFINDSDTEYKSNENNGPDYNNQINEMNEKTPKPLPLSNSKHKNDTELLPQNTPKITHGKSSTIDFDLYKYNHNKTNKDTPVTPVTPVTPATPGSCDENTIFDIDMNMNNNIPKYNRSLSTMSGLIMKAAEQNDDIAASSVLHMMVNQGFYPKRNLNSVSQIKNLAM